MRLAQIQKRFHRIAEALGVDRSIPTKPTQDGGPHAEYARGTYFYIVTECGNEYERRQTNDDSELLSWFVRDLTRELAQEWELKNRIRGQDTRRLWFQKHIELLGQIDLMWAEKQQIEYDSVLDSNPFDDACDDRIKYFNQLQRDGLKHDEAWQQALSKYPEPVAT